MRTMLAVPTRSRQELVGKNLSKMNVRPVYFVEPRQVRAYEEALAGRAEFRVLGMNDGGVGYARQQIILEAADAGYDYVIMSDDDKVLPDNIWELADAVEWYGLAGCTPWQRHMQHLIKIKADTGVHAHGGSMGSQIYALDVQMVMEIGNFDPRLKAAAEDNDLKLRAIRHTLAPWAIHTDVQVRATGTRYAEGGVESLRNTDREKERSLQLFVEKYDGYVKIMRSPARGVSKNSKVFSRVSWKKWYRDAGMDYPPVLPDPAG